jgi:hypothetical protein
VVFLCECGTPARVQVSLRGRCAVERPRAPLEVCQEPHLECGVGEDYANAMSIAQPPGIEQLLSPLVNIEHAIYLIKRVASDDILVDLMEGRPDRRNWVSAVGTADNDSQSVAHMLFVSQPAEICRLALLSLPYD